MEAERRNEGHSVRIRVPRYKAQGQKNTWWEGLVVMLSIHLRHVTFFLQDQALLLRPVARVLEGTWFMEGAGLALLIFSPLSPSDFTTTVLEGKDRGRHRMLQLPALPPYSSSGKR